jgi:hypothetical protein
MTMTDVTSQVNHSAASMKVRDAAFALAGLDEFDRTGTPREVLFDVAEALEVLRGPVRAVIEGYFDDVAPGDVAAVMSALSVAETSVRRFADNV